MQPNQDYTSAWLIVNINAKVDGGKVGVDWTPIRIIGVAAYQAPKVACKQCASTEENIWLASERQTLGKAIDCELNVQQDSMMVPDRGHSTMVPLAFSQTQDAKGPPAEWSH